MRHRVTNLVAFAVAVTAAVAVLYLSESLFPYHSTNHDEGVYLQQASMLLEGQLSMRAPSPELAEAFRPWFFVVDGAEMYPKYSPVPGVVFALGKLLGGFRLALGAVAFVNAFLVYLVTREAFDETVGVVASALLVLSPFFLINSSVFLPYATTTAFNLLFALGYLRGFVTSGNVRFGYAVLAGFGIGVSFFSRPYTAILFAAPFILHGVYTLYGLYRRRADHGDLKRHLVGYAALSSVGVVFVGVTLAYNSVMTGSAFTFPYLEFAPDDGLGFGRRAILGYERDYTPLLGLRSNAYALWYLVSDWTTAGVVGSSLAAVGGVFAVFGDEDARGERGARLLLVGVFASFVIGNVYFWGTLNALGEIGDTTDGLVHLYGPYYHYDLLLPVSAFMAFAVVLGYRRLRSLTTVDRLRDREQVALLALVVALFVVVSFATVGVAEVNEKVEKNAEVTGVYESAYQPFEGTEFDGALVFLPRPYGDWLNHPFQYLRNSPNLNGNVVYAVDRGPENFDVVDAYPNRTYYGYSYRGEWEPYTGETVEPHLRQVAVTEGEKVRATTEIDETEGGSVSVTLRSGDDSARYTETVNGSFSVSLIMSAENGTVYPEQSPNSSVSVAERGELEVTVHVVRGYLNEATYRQTYSVEVTDGTVRALSPETRYCPSATGCQGGSAYVSPDGVRTEIVAISDAPAREP